MPRPEFFPSPKQQEYIDILINEFNILTVFNSLAFDYLDDNVDTLEEGLTKAEVIENKYAVVLFIFNSLGGEFLRQLEENGVPVGPFLYWIFDDFVESLYSLGEDDEDYWNQGGPYHK